MKRLVMEYLNRKDFKEDEDLRLKGMAFDKLDEYLQKIIKNDGADGVLAALNVKNNKSAVELVYELTEHFRKRLNSVYQDSLEE